MKKISEIIRTHRKASGLTQEQLAKIAGIGKTAVFDIEKGKDTVRYDTLLKVMNALNIKFKFESPLLNKRS
jgi:HTH-type transcriptional regulator / antitoxin HipB